MERHCMCPHRNPLAAVGEQGWRCVRPPSPTGGWIMDGRKILETGMTRCGAMTGVGPASYYGMGCWCADSRPEGASGAWGGRCRGAPTEIRRIRAGPKRCSGTSSSTSVEAGWCSLGSQVALQ